MIYMPDGTNINNFRASEFQCRCGECGGGIEDMDEGFLESLDHARDEAGVPFIITSAFRCKKHNSSDAVKGSPTSSHLNGTAADISVDGNYRRWKIINGLLSAGFHRIGIGENFIHADMDPDKKQEVIWTYGK